MTTTNEAAELKPETVGLLVAKINEAATVEEVKEIAGTDERKGVVSAAAKRIAEIETKSTQQPEDVLPAQKNTRTVNKIYEEFPVRPQYEDVSDQLGKVIGKKLTGYKKESLEPIRTVSLDPAKAEILNSQSVNTLVHLFEKQ
jgi:hypothetical protein